MVDVLLDLLGTFLGLQIGTGWQEKARVRRTARLVAAGRAAVFPGWVLGPRPYCRPGGGFLVLTPTALGYDADRGVPVTRRHVPIDRLVVRERRTATWDDHKQMPPDWELLDCLDGDDRILIACHKLEMPYVESLFRSRP